MATEPRRVLVVEDDPALCEYVQAALRDGYEVHGVRCGEAALEWLETHPVDLFVLDMRMWPMTGVELLEKIHERGLPLPPVVITTGYVLHDETEPVRTALARLAYPVEIVTKPFGLSELEGAVSAVLDQAEHGRERSQRE
jgi:two-component system response regulator CpxR